MQRPAPRAGGSSHTSWHPWGHSGSRSASNIYWLAHQYKRYLLANTHLLTATPKRLLLPRRWKSRPWVLPQWVTGTAAEATGVVTDCPVSGLGVVSEFKCVEVHLEIIHIEYRLTMWLGNPVWVYFRYHWKAERERESGIFIVLKNRYREGSSHTSAPRLAASKWVTTVSITHNISILGLQPEYIYIYM